MSYIIVVAAPFASLSDELKGLFGEVGTVSSVSTAAKQKLLTDLGDEIQLFLDRPQISSYHLYSVKMPARHEATAAIQKFEGFELPGSPGSMLMLSGPHGPGDEP